MSLNYFIDGVVFALARAFSIFIVYITFVYKWFSKMIFQILYAKDVDQRSVTFEKSIEMGNEYQRRTKAVIIRSLIIKHNISVKVNNT